MRLVVGFSVVAGLAAGSLGLAEATAEAGYGGPPPPTAPAASVDANGNAVTGGLGFDPVKVKVAVGDDVRWTNRDTFAPHTVTEDHGLFDLAGSYGMTPVNPAGFGPGETRDLTVSGGTFHYYCRVHGASAMHGTIKVPDTVARAGHHRVRVTWSDTAPASGQAFDVERRKHGVWRMVLKGTTKLSATFPAAGGKFRSRVRVGSSRTRASDWSPPAG